MSSLAYRQIEPQDKAFIFDSWLESFRTSHSAGLIAMNDWREVMAPQLEKVLARPGVKVLVAHRPGEVDRTADIYGWLAIERDYQIPVRSYGSEGNQISKMAAALLPLVHYVFVKQPYRRLGIARGLFNAAGVNPNQHFAYTCKTAVVSRLSDKIPNASWQPLVARFPK